MSYNYRPLSAEQARALYYDDRNEEARKRTQKASIELEFLYKEIACAAIRKERSFTHYMEGDDTYLCALVQEDLERYGYQVTYTRAIRSKQQPARLIIQWLRSDKHV